MVSEFDREEAAFRDAFARHAEDAGTTGFGTPRRHWRAPLLVAAVVLLIVGAAVGAVSTRDDKPDSSPADGTGLEHAQWIGIRNIEVKAPADWAPKYEPALPECIRGNTNDPAQPSLMKQGYVVIGVPERFINAIGCVRTRDVGDPDAAFGDLPFPLWRPYVKVVPARPDLAEGNEEYRDGAWEFRGWRLTRKTVDDVQVSVLSVPGDDALGPEVMSSARRVSWNSLGCPVDSAVLDHPDVDARPLPAPSDVTGVVVCDYERNQWGHGLAGSRELAGNAASALVTAIQDAPPVPSAGRGTTCRHRTDRALTLLFRGSGGQVATSAFVYVDSCAENGVVVPGLGTRQLTRSDCSPLFAEPPIGLFIPRTSAVRRACSSQPGDDQYAVPEPF